MKHKNRWLTLPVVVLLMGVLFLPGTASADPATAVDVTPPSQTVSPGGAFTVDIYITPDTAICGVQFDLSFDPSLVTADSVIEGNLLNQGGASTYFVVWGGIDNVSGTISDVVGAIITGGATVSSPGIFATINFTAREAVGTSPLDLSNVIVGNISGQPVTIEVTNGEVTVGVTELAILEGQVTLQGRPSPPDASWVTDLTVTFIQDSTVERTAGVTTDSEGQFTIDDVEPGTYDIGVKSPRALSELVTGVVMVAGAATPVDFGTLREGDANNDDAINELDYSLLHSYYGVTSGEGLDKCDFNRNGAVEELDYSLLHSNYGQIGDLYEE